MSEPTAAAGPTTARTDNGEAAPPGSGPANTPAPPASASPSATASPAVTSAPSGTALPSATASPFASAPPGSAADPVRAFLRLVTIEHSVFALPFAYLSALTVMRADGGHLRWGDLALITVAMVAARTFAMAANRIIDRHIDARNPRTARRELVTGAVRVSTAWTGAGVALVVFLAAAALLNPLCLLLAPLAVVPLVVYPYGKRFTNWPHAILALAQVPGPVGAWLAVTGTLDGSGPAWLLGVAVGLWIGGFDLIYACQDTEVDRRIGVRSVPARYGLAFALHLSTLVHVVTFALFIWFGVLVGLGWLWWVGLLLTALSFGYQHVVVTPADLSRVNRAFFTANGFVGIVLFVFALLDLVFRLGLGA